MIGPLFVVLASITWLNTGMRRKGFAYVGIYFPVRSSEWLPVLPRTACVYSGTDYTLFNLLRGFAPLLHLLSQL